MCYICVHLNAYVICEQLSVKLLYDMYEAYTYVIQCTHGSLTFCMNKVYSFLFFSIHI